MKTSKGEHYPLGVVRRFIEDREGNLWIATDNAGLVRFNRGDNTFKIYTYQSHKSGLASNTIHDLYQDEEGYIWLATYAGLQKYNPLTEEFYTYVNNINDSRSISSNIIRTIYEDRTGIVWVGTNNHGLNKFDRKYRKFTNFRNQLGDPLCFQSSIVRTFLEDNTGNLWIGTYGEGITVFNPSTSKSAKIVHKEFNSNSLVDNYVTSIVQDKNNNIWISTNNGLSKYNPLTKIFTNYLHNPSNSNSLPDNKIRKLLLDENDTLWIGTISEGLCKLNMVTNTFTSYIPNPANPDRTLSQERISTMYEDNYGNFWVGTSGEGLNLFNRATGVVRQYKNYPDDLNSISSNRIFCLYHDSKNRLWIGTDEGLNMFNYGDETFTKFTTHDGLPNDVIYGILEDDIGNIWVSTNYGISHFNPNVEGKIQFNNYSKFDGLQNSEFAEGSYLKTKSGLLLFGGISNFNIINPKNIQNNPIPPAVYITEIRILDRNAKVDEKKEEIVNVIDRDVLELDYAQNNLSFQYVALHYSNSTRNRYKYRLEGFESTWTIPKEEQRFASYTNLKPGKYKFLVIASNADGVWNETGDEITIVIHPPFWQTWWFLVIMLLLVFSAMHGIVMFREANLIKKKKELEEIVSYRTAELQQQTEKLKQANEEIMTNSTVLYEQNQLLMEKNEEISAQREELELQSNSLANIAWELQDKNEAIEKQKNILAYQKKEITDSIQYAKRIQQAVLPGQEQIKDLFPEYFIFNRPKSIVSGDFYWASRVNHYRIVAAVDCTGHGVPGGFMSMLGVLMLNEVVNQREIVDPKKVLNYLRQNIISVLHQTGDLSDTSDGMDISLCVINDKDLTLNFSGANSSMLILQENDNGEYEMTCLFSDRMPISYHFEMKSFTNQTVKLKPNAFIYLYSDGIIDQFGGDFGKKFQLSRMKEFILANKFLPLKTQGIVLEQQFNSWKGNTFQVDDVLVMGLKV